VNVGLNSSAWRLLLAAKAKRYPHIAALSTGYSIFGIFEGACSGEALSRRCRANWGAVIRIVLGGVERAVAEECFCQKS